MFFEKFQQNKWQLWVWRYAFDLQRVVILLVESLEFNLLGTWQFSHNGLDIIKAADLDACPLSRNVIWWS